MTLYLSRLRLRRDPGTEALKALIDPAEEGRAMDAHHRLLWTLFADDSDRRRDFLWRADGPGRFFALSARPPSPAPLFEPPEVKAFQPALELGDRLFFVLRANATRSLRAEGAKRGQRVDIVMALLHDVPGKAELADDAESERAAKRMPLAREAAAAWMAGQGDRHGFSVETLEVCDYSVQALPRAKGRRSGQPQFGVLDLAGVLAVSDPGRFIDALAQGFGRAKAFGCGLMMIRRA